MTQTPNHQDTSADALKAMADGTHKGDPGSPDGFVGPEKDEEQEEREDVEGVEPAGDDGIGFAPQGGAGEPAAASPAAPGAGAPAPVYVAGPSRQARMAEFERKQALVHSKQYKTVMIPLLVTMGIILMVMGLFTIVRGNVLHKADSLMGTLFPLVSLPLGAFLLVGAWWFHRDVNRRK